ncbi:MAG TPA: ribosome biogenesis GTP-binding protein YihA/YsxC [Prolixibacteraceae bacterium]|nr:ribosome biogenesis GTP-binding protein YihA/YsxC [Prolixibacteraceae bacterium]
MDIKEARFIVSNTDVAKCPKPDKPEYAFIGRSNVGKSSLINMLAKKKSLAKTSGSPGKTKLINHFEIDSDWYLVDLPGYGYAKIAKAERKKWEKLIRNYILLRQNLICLFVLIDARHEPQKSDLEFMEWLGMDQIPFAIIFTKIDKLKPEVLSGKLKAYEQKMMETWESMPVTFLTSAEKGTGRNEILSYIKTLNKTAES